MSGWSDGAMTLRTDPLERADITYNTYYDWFLSKAPRLLAAQASVGSFMAHEVEPIVTKTADLLARRVDHDVRGA
jgi:hypothetical protein